LHDTYHSGNADGKGTTSDIRGRAAWKHHWFQATLAIATIAGGAFVCVAGLYVTIQGIIDAYASGEVGKAFAC